MNFSVELRFGSTYCMPLKSACAQCRILLPDSSNSCVARSYPSCPQNSPYVLTLQHCIESVPQHAVNSLRFLAEAWQWLYGLSKKWLKLIETWSLFNSISYAHLKAVVHTVPENGRDLVDHSGRHAWLPSKHVWGTITCSTNKPLLEKMSSVKPRWDGSLSNAVWMTSSGVTGSSTVCKKKNQWLFTCSDRDYYYWFLLMVVDWLINQNVTRMEIFELLSKISAIICFCISVAMCWLIFAQEFSECEVPHPIHSGLGCLCLFLCQVMAFWILWFYKQF